MCQLAQLAVALLRLLERLAEERLGLSVFVPERSLSQLGRHDRVHQPLLRAVVQIPHHAAAGLVSGGQQARPRGDELVTAVGIRDRGVEQLGELRLRSSVSPGGDRSPPQLAMITPQSRPSTTIGTPTAALTWHSTERARSAIGPRARS